MKILFVLIDDKSAGLDLIKKAVSQIDISKDVIDYLWFDSYELFRQANVKRVTAIFLDYHLDKDGMYGTKIVKHLNAKYLIGFSTSLKGSERIYKKGIQSGHFEPQNLFFVEKNPEVPPSQELIEVIRNIIEKELLSA